MTSRVPLAATLAAVLALAPQAARASGQNGGSDSKSNSSQGSADSSNTSNDSSKSSSNSSNGSSKDSDNSTQNSPKDTSDYTTKGSSDWSTHSRGAHVFSVALAVVAVGASVIGTVAANRGSQQQTTVALAAFMRRQHALLTHDVATAEGPVLAAWSRDLRLSDEERRRLRRALDGSAEQGALLEALDGPIDETRARRFAAAFLRVTERALGKARTGALVARATTATWAG
jgi:hypothetical protein